MTDSTPRKSAAIASKMASAPGAPRIGRRGFFGVSLGVAATSIAGGAALPAFASETGNERSKARYQADSEHVKEFYHVNRYVWPEGK